MFRHKFFLMKRLALFFISVIFILVSCKSRSKSETVSVPVNRGDAPVRQEITATTNVRLLVSFISIGAGIDAAIKEKYDAFLSGQQKKIKYDEAHWGREGEVDYCFLLSELSKKEQDDFVAKSKLMLSGSKLVIVSENVPCDKKK